MKRKITWENAASLIEYATSQQFHIIDEETNQRIINLLNSNKNKAKDLLTVLRKRMIYNQYDNVISLSLTLITKIIIECPDCIPYFSTEDWQQCFISLVFNKQNTSTSLSIETKVQLLYLISNMKESFPNDLLFQETYNMIKLCGIDLPKVEKTFTELIEEKESQQQTQLFQSIQHNCIKKEELLKQCEELLSICFTLDETFNYFTIGELNTLKDNEEINEMITKLENAQQVLTVLLRRKNLSNDVVDKLKSTSTTIQLILDKHLKLTQKWMHFISSSNPIFENTQFYYQSQRKK